MGAFAVREPTCFLCIYAPCDSKTRSELFASLLPPLNVPCIVIIGGNFNCFMEKGDGVGESCGVDVSSGILKSVVWGHDLAERRVIGTGLGNPYTRRSGASQTRVDRFYASTDELSQVVGYAVTWPSRSLTTT